MEPIEIMLRHGATFWAAGNNGTVFALERDPLEAAGIVPEIICPAFNTMPRIALKVMHKSIPGIAADERDLQDLAVKLLAEMGIEPPVGVPRILSDSTSGKLSDSRLLTRMAGLRPTGGHVEYLFMEWVEGVDFATLLYRTALQSGLQRTRESHQDWQVVYELQTIMNVFLDTRILKYADRLDAMELDALRVHRVGGQLRAEIRSGKNPAQLWHRFLPEARTIALEAFQCGEIVHALTQLLEGDGEAALNLIDSECDINVLELALATVHADFLLNFIKVNNDKGRREGFYDMIKNLVKGHLILPESIHADLHKTLVFLNGCQYHHNDLHERNIMISNDRQRGFMIDVATATYQKQKESGDTGILAPTGLLYAVTRGASDYNADILVR